MDSRFNQLFSVFAIFIVVIGFGVLLNLDDSQLNNSGLDFNNLFGSEGNVLTGAAIGVASNEEVVVEENSTELESSGSLLSAGDESSGDLGLQADCGDTIGTCACGDVVGESYNLSFDLTCTGTGIEINDDNVVFDCRGHSITGDGDDIDNGIKNAPFGAVHNNVTIKNCVIKNFGTGISFMHATNATIWNNTVGHINISLPNFGISFSNCSEANISNNVITNMTSTGVDSAFGIMYSEAPNSALHDVVIYGNNISRMYGTDNVPPIAISLGDAEINDLNNVKFDNNIIENINCTTGSTGSCITFGGIGLKINSGTNVNITNNQFNHLGIGIMPDQPGLRITGNSFTTNGYGIYAMNNMGFATTRFNHSWIEDNTFDGLTEGVSLFGNNHNNTFLNNNFSNNLPFSIRDDTVSITNNTVIYNSSMGEIKWDKANITTGITLGVNSSDLYIENGTIGLINSVNTLKLNDTAQITFKGLFYPVIPWLMKDGVRCDDSIACNISYDSSIGVLIANISSFSNYTLQETTPPYFDPTPVDQIVQYGDAFTYDVNGTDDTGIGNYSVNDTTQFSINDSGMITNAIPLHYGPITINISINDTFNNLNSTIIIVDVIDTLPPGFTEPLNPQSVAADENFVYDINGTDNYNVSSYTVNDTIRFRINSSGHLSNSTILTAADYNIDITLNDTFNNSASLFFTLTVTAGADVTPPYFDPTPTNQTAQYAIQFLYDINGTDNIAVGNYSVNDTTQFRINGSGMISNATHLHYGVYALNISLNDTSNNVNSTVIFINVTDTTPSSFSPTPTNQTVQYLANFFYDLNGSDNYNVSSFTVNDTNQFKINSSGGLTNVSNLHFGVIAVNVSINDTFNNTNSTIIFVNITDTTPPSFSPTPTNQSAEYLTNFFYDIDGSDNYNISTFTINDTVSFQINSSGGLTNKTNNILMGVYGINISVNDTFNNTNSTIIFINVSDTISATIDVIGPVGPTNGTGIQLELLTSENASCYYKNATISYTIMDVTLANITHQHILTNSFSAGNHQYNFFCNDTSNNNASASTILFVTTNNVTNSSVVSSTLTANTSNILDLTTELNLTFNVSKDYSTAISVSMYKYNTTPETSAFAVTGSTVTEFKYYVIDAPAVSGNINKITMKFTYNETQVVVAGIAEADLVVYYYNATADTWTAESEYAVDTDLNHLEVNVTHLSTFVLGKSAVTAAAAADTAAGSSASSTSGSSLPPVPTPSSGSAAAAFIKDDAGNVLEDEDKVQESSSEADENRKLGLTGWNKYQDIILSLSGILIGILVLVIIGSLFVRSHHDMLLKRKYNTGESSWSKIKMFFRDNQKNVKLILMVVVGLLFLGLLVYLIYSSWSQIVSFFSKVWAWLYSIGVLNQFRGIFIALIILLVIGALFIRSHHEFLLKSKSSKNKKVNNFKWKTFFRKHGEMIKLVSTIVIILLILAGVGYLIYFYFSAISSFFSGIWSWLFN